MNDRARTKLVKMYERCPRSINTTNDLNLRSSSSIGPASVTDNKSNIDHRMTQQKAELAKEGLTFAFALACAAAHVGPKSGSSEEPTYEIWFKRVSPSRSQMTNSQKGGDWGRQRGILEVLGYLTVPGRERKRPDLLRYLTEFVWKGPPRLKLKIHFLKESLLQ